jgi:hypothetical protein
VAANHARNVAARAKTKKTNRKSSRRLLLTPAVPEVVEVLHIPTRWLNAIIGFFLLIPAGLLTQTFFNSFSEAALRHAFWATEEFWFFSLGAVLWTLWFFGSIWAMGEPRPLRAYVFGHELTHAIWVWLMGGRVNQFEVRRDGGHILTDTHNFWIALAPYFYPIYSIAVVALYGAISIFYNLIDVNLTLLGMSPLQWLFLTLGLTWGFHMSFTCWMIPKGQTDLTQHGTFFSLVVIYTVNLLLLAGLLIVAAPEVSWRSFGTNLLENTEDFSSLVWNALTL